MVDSAVDQVVSTFLAKIFVNTIFKQENLVDLAGITRIQEEEEER